MTEIRGEKSRKRQAEAGANGGPEECKRLKAELERAQKTQLEQEERIREFRRVQQEAEARRAVVAPNVTPQVPVLAPPPIPQQPPNPVPNIPVIPGQPIPPQTYPGMTAALEAQRVQLQQ